MILNSINKWFENVHHGSWPLKPIFSDPAKFLVD